MVYNYTLYEFLKKRNIHVQTFLAECYVECTSLYALLRTERDVCTTSGTFVDKSNAQQNKTQHISLITFYPICVVVVDGKSV